MQGIIKKYKETTLKFILVILTVVVVTPNLFAGVEHFSNKIELCDIVAGASVVVTDDKYPIMSANPGTWQNTFKIKGVSDGRIVLKMNPTDKTIYPDFQITATVSVSYVNQALATVSIPNITLSLDYDPVTGGLSIDQNVYHFTDVHDMTVTLNTLTLDPILNGVTPKGLILQTEIDVERYYAFSHTFTPTISHTIIDADASVDRTLGLNWPVVDGAEEYDLEWTFIDDYNAIGGAKAFDFKNNATRVTLSANNYEIPLIYEKGYILYRVRAVSKLEPNFSQRVEGTWSSDAFSYTDVNGYPNKYYVNPHESDNFNWGYQSFFTEQGVRGEGVSYFDGTLKNRQNLSKLNTEDKVVVQETFYDYQGRPAISALPVPIDERTFKYRDNFNLDENGIEFKADYFDVDGATPKMSISSGASNYYSPLNPDQDGINAYIPNAKQYPFTQTVYTNDLTGRIKSQGGLGGDHTIGSGNETKYYYGMPFQRKLTKLFGTDVGYQESYLQTVVVDPNGQTSVSVTDASGRVIITNLAGNLPNNLEALPSYINKEQANASVLNNTSDDLDGYGTINSTFYYTSVAAGDHDFIYSLDPATYDPCVADAMCFDCVYELVISIKDKNVEMIPNGPHVETIGAINPLNNSCENSVYNYPTTGVLTVPLLTGVYTITKELRVSQVAIDNYADQYIRESECLDGYHDFFDVFISQTDFSGCDTDPCILACQAQLGLEANYPGGSAAYQIALNACVLACESPQTPCEIYRENMLLDMSIGGQYGLYLDATGFATDPNLYPLSVFNVNNSLPTLNANWTNPANNSIPNTANYYDADGITLSEIEVIDLGGGNYSPAVNAVNVMGTVGAYYTYPQHLINVSDFIDNWKPSWAEALLPYHPEYCHLGFMCDIDDQSPYFHVYSSGIYDQDMLYTFTYDGAYAAGYLNPLNNSHLSGLVFPTLLDPFYNFLNASEQTSFKDALTYYDVGGGNVSIWDLAFTMVYSPSQTGYTVSDVNTCLSLYSNEYFDDICLKDEVWRQFRELYLAKKAEYFDLKLVAYAIENGCYNGCFGVGASPFSSLSSNINYTSFSFNNFVSTSGVTTNEYINPDQPCNDPDYLLYVNKNKVFTTIYDEYSPANYPPNPVLVAAQAQADVDAFCQSSCQTYATEWLNQLSGCANFTTLSGPLEIELKELCELQCDPTNTTFPITTNNGNTTVEEVINYHITQSSSFSTLCHPMVLVQPGPTQPIYDPTKLAVLDDCGCDKVLQNEADFTGSGFATSQELFYDVYGFLPLNYQNIVCKCNDIAPSWSTGYNWTSTELNALSYLALPVVEELECDQCVSCTDVTAYQSDFDVDYAFLSGDPDYYLFLTNYINTNYNFNFSSFQVEQLITNCTLLNASGNTVWNDNKEGAELELLLHKLNSFGDLFQTSPIDLTTYFGTSSLQQYTMGYDYWSDGLNSCTGNILELHIGDGANQASPEATITLDLTNASPSGYNFDFCNIISLDNLQKVTSATCTNFNDFTIDATIMDGLQTVVVTIEGTSTVYPVSTCVSNSADLALCKNTFNSSDANPCTDFLVQTAEDNALQAYLQYLLDEKNRITAELKDRCMNGSTETFDMTYWDQEHHFTLYYYDQSGNLVKTVPPEGVKPFADPINDIPAADVSRDNNGSPLRPPHELETKYRYNSYNQLTEQKTPDAGKGQFWYDIAGRLVASQNAEQKASIDEEYSYTIYDEFGRIVEVGEKTFGTAMNKLVANDPVQLQTWYSSGVNAQITRTFYDRTLDPAIDAYFTGGQENLRLRVATVAFYESYGVNMAYDNAIHYSYDVAGNVEHAVMENKELELINNSLKHLSYEYDLVSGNVNQVIFQEGETDQYYHKYHYDADNRIHEVSTSKNGVIWEKDAKYFYYKHGPLARIELGDEKVQGIDLAYTIQGWLKGTNSNTLDATRDIGKDAIQGYLANAPEIHTSVAKDAFGYSLNYFDNDYEAIGQPTQNFEATIAGSAYDVSNSNLFNGNIKGMVTAIEGMEIYGNAYKYDQLNRLRTSTVFNNLNVLGNTWVGSTGVNDYFTDIHYDANGNISTLLRNGVTTNQLAMDNMSYDYYPNTNQLAHVTDATADFSGYSDIKQGMITNNYEYDELGNLIKDPSEEIYDIEWTVYGKVKSITRENNSSKPDLEFKYDAMGNRIMKLEKPRTGSGLDNENEWVYSYYQYDAGGNMLAIYDKRYLHISGNNYQTVLKVKEMNLYGSSRLGIDGRDKILVEEDFTATISGGLFTGINVTSTNYIADDPNLMDRTLGKKAFELSNHLGNVLATVSDKKFLNQTTGNAKVYASSYENTDGGIFVNGSYLGMQSTDQVNTGTHSIIQSNGGSPIGPKTRVKVHAGDLINNTVVSFYFSSILTGDGQLVRSLVDANGVALYKDAVGTTTKEVGLPLYFPASWQQLSIGGTTTIQSTYYYADGTALPTCDAVYLEVYTECTDGTVWFDDISFSVTPAVESYYTADIQTRQMYYPFGMVMPNSNNLGAGTYRYGMNGMEQDSEVKGGGNSYTSYWRQYDPRLGRWMSDEPKPVAWESGYAAFRNNPIYFADPSGDFPKIGEFFKKLGGKIKNFVRTKILGKPPTVGKRGAPKTPKPKTPGNPGKTRTGATGHLYINLPTVMINAVDNTTPRDGGTPSVGTAPKQFEADGIGVFGDAGDNRESLAREGDYSMSVVLSELTAMFDLIKARILKNTKSAKSAAKAKFDNDLKTQDGRNKTMIKRVNETMLDRSVKDVSNEAHDGDPNEKVKNVEAAADAQYSIDYEFNSNSSKEFHLGDYPATDTSEAKKMIRDYLNQDIKIKVRRK